MRNNALLEATMQHIIDHPESHYQGFWFSQTDCGTVACFAGRACLLSGITPVIRGVRARIMRDGLWWPVAGVAADLLGLTHRESQTLFDVGNTSTMLQAMVKDLVNGDDLKTSDFYREEAA